MSGTTDATNTIDPSETTAVDPADAPTDPSMRRIGSRAWMQDHWPFLTLLGFGLVLRVVFMVAFPPAFIYSDGPAYLAFVDQIFASPDRPIGYGVVLHVLAWLTRGVWLVAVTQHLLGLAGAVILYALLRRYSVGRWPAALATTPMLLDSMQLLLEHSVLSDVVFELLLVSGIALLAWRSRPSVRVAAVVGLVFAAATLVRLAGEPVVLAAALFCLLAGGTWSRRLATVGALVACFVAPLVAYATWYHHERGAFALAEIEGRALYMRTTAFVDCSKLTGVPDYEVGLCPKEPVGSRQDPTDYVWHDPGTVHALVPPTGTTVDEAAHDFAMRAIRAQPLDYAQVVVRDFLMNFKPTREDHYEYDTAYKWRVLHYVGLQPSDWTGPAFEDHGGVMQQTNQPWADALASYGRFGYLWGPALLTCLVVAVAGMARRRGPRMRDVRRLTLLLTIIGTGVMLVPDVTAEFVWRYQLPAVVLLPAAAALGWTRLRARQAPGTVATPSTD